MRLSRGLSIPYDTGMATAVDWAAVQWVLLDMDGTLLDLAFDSYFWSEALPRAYARRRGLSEAAARAALAPLFEGERGRLNWYCLDWWSAQTGLDLRALKRGIAERVSVLPGTPSFLSAARAARRRLWLVTNAHRDSLALKMERTGLANRFDALICAHDFGVPKEDPRFWPLLRHRHRFDPARALLLDDSVAVLTAARAFGIRQVVAVNRPDSTRPAQPIAGFASVASIDELLPIRAPAA